MNPNDVKAYVAQHLSDDSLHLERIEWIDDNSANLLFASENIALQALQALSAADYHISDASQLPARQLLPAKSFSEKPEVTLQVRPALESDKKQAGAASRSRFYLLNPEYDPEERRRKNERRYRDRNGDDLSRRRGRQARADESDEPFDVNLYDDSSIPAETKGRSRRRRSLTPDYKTTEPRIDSYRPSNRGKELFPENLGSRHRTSRNRSASPVHDRDGDRDMNDLANNGSAVARERNRYRAQAIKSHLSRQNRAKELFPSEAASESGRLGDKVEDAATLLSKGITLPLMDGSSDAPAVDARKLADRVTVPGKGKLAARITSPGPTGGAAFNIRGVADRRSSNTGFAIKGSAGKSVRELFPDKFGQNTGKELFGDIAGGRPRQRQRAGDLFD
ncbi:hypothetical protein RRF57_002971 [Xylaria bambusicola]|uniref:Uncharacterized protein n=1 Tax=Xylaria bambusicola TaxID=326684 RepID=A0AAN7UJJ1_9PEZI